MVKKFYISGMLPNYSWNSLEELKVRLILTLVGSFILTACAAGQPFQLDPNADRVRIGKSDPPDNFTELGPVTGTNGTGCGAIGQRGTYEGAVTNLKNAAYRMGADYVQIMTISEPHLAGDCFRNAYIISGSAYKQTADTPSPIPIVEKSNDSTIMRKLRELQSLRDDGVINQQEFEELKARVLEGN